MSAAHRLRAATVDDIATLERLEAHFPTDRLRRRQWRHLLTGARADVWVITLDGAVVADAVVLYRRGSCHARLYSLVVQAGRRGSGFGRILLAAAEAAAVRRGCRNIGLEVRPDNSSALRLYRDSGYSVTTRKAGYYEDGSEALRLDKSLARALAA